MGIINGASVNYRCRKFKIQELVGPKCFAERGERAWELLNAGVLRDIDRVSELFGPVTINNWHSGGTFKESGLRDHDTSTGARWSAHKFGFGFDLKFKTVTVKQVYDYILAHRDEFPSITVIEDIAHTPTWLHVDGRNHDRTGIWIVKP